jgi:SAM-dependent methyltransferase
MVDILVVRSLVNRPHASTMSRPNLPQPLRAPLRRAFESVALRLPGPEPLVPPSRLHTVGDGDFKATGEEFLGLFQELVGLRSEDRVLDVGCGVGRIARSLAGYLSGSGSYDGFDVAEVAIKWCQRNYDPKYPNFHFKHVNVANGSYNPVGGSSAESFSFPYPTESFDFVFLTSVFTHMMPAEIEHYTQEIARVLAPGGRCLATFFLLNDESRELIAQGRSTQPFTHSTPPYAIVDPAAPEDAVAYEQEWLLAQLASAGLRARAPVNYGSWCGRKAFTSYQDIVVADRATLPSATSPTG